MRRVGVRAATDVTGFGLLGHLGELLQASDVSATLDAGAIPMIDGVGDLIAAGVVPGGTMRNLASVRKFTDFGELDEHGQIALADAQTSGGLLMAVDAPLVDALMHALLEEGVVGHRIGALVAREFVHGPSGRITVTP